MTNDIDTTFLRPFYENRIMEIIISKQINSLTGMLNNKWGYNIQHRKNGFFAKRNPRGYVPPDGHLQIILHCAELAQSKLYVTDVNVHWLELSDALYEAGKYPANQVVRKNGVEGVKTSYDARDIVNLETTFSL